MRRALTESSVVPSWISVTHEEIMMQTIARETCSKPLLRSIKMQAKNHETRYI